MHPVKWLPALVLLLVSTPAFAHGGPTGHTGWSFEPSAVAPLALSGGLYLSGTLRLWRRAGIGRGIHAWQAVCFWTGWAILALALLSPLSPLSEHLFVAHMIEHEVMVTIAAPLLVVSRPIGAFLWAFPLSWRQALGRFGHLAVTRACWLFLTGAAVATILHGMVLWVWHVPALFTAALASLPLHWLQHLAFFVTALLFWQSLMAARSRQGGDGPALFWLFVTILHTGFLGILLALSPSPWIPRQTDLAAGFGLTPLEDQQLAGLVMWVPGGLIYTGVALALAARWIRSAGERARRSQLHA